MCLVNIFCVCDLSFHPLDSDFFREEVFNFIEVQTIRYFFQGLCP
jgi:hypothetical protein